MRDVVSTLIQCQFAVWGSIPLKINSPLKKMNRIFTSGTRMLIFTNNFSNRPVLNSRYWLRPKLNC